VARAHPQGRALPRSTISLGVLAIQGIGPSAALAEWPPNKRLQLPAAVQAPGPASGRGIMIRARLQLSREPLARD